ncbi:lactate utilization protein [Pseudomonas sp. R2.Fl]|nr:lactate utilization protein [Pseudomonas sp. R2.Fl]
MQGKTAILAKIRSALHVSPQDPERQAAVAGRLNEPPVGIVPNRGQLPEEERIALFRKMAEKYSATTARIATLAELPTTVGDFLRTKNLPLSARMGSDRLLRTVPWETEATLDIRDGASDGLDLVGISHAFGAVAETGTLALASGPDNPATINFLPEQHIVVVRAEDVAGDMETVIGRLRQATGRGKMPRTLYFVTGPSRSADIEQTLLLGAHGPKGLHIVIVG